MYIQTKMDFMDTSSLGVTYRYVVKSSRNLSSKTSSSLGQQIRNNRSMVRVDLNSREKDRERMENPKTTSPSHQKRRVMESRRRKLESGVSSTKSLDTILINITPNSHYWLRRKPHGRMLTKTLIQNQKRENGSLMQNPV
jgi:hypothetical protein